MENPPPGVVTGGGFKSDRAGQQINLRHSQPSSDFQDAARNFGIADTGDIALVDQISWRGCGIYEAGPFTAAVATAAVAALVLTHVLAVSS